MAASPKVGSFHAYVLGTYRPSYSSQSAKYVSTWRCRSLLTDSPSRTSGHLSNAFLCATPRGHRFACDFWNVGLPAGIFHDAYCGCWGQRTNNSITINRLNNRLGQV